MNEYNFKRPINTEGFSDATSLLKDFENGKTTSLDLIERSLRNIADNHERLNAMTQLFAKEALEEAKKSTNKKSTDKKGKLEGIPISLKEVIGVKGEEITAGSMRMPVKIAENDALVVQRLKNEGAIIIARTNMPEFSFGHETRSPRFGVTNNPYLKNYIPGGSSGGESALISSGGSIIGIGTDVGGSIRYPAHCCGLVGFKPSGMAASKKGIFPFVEREDWYLNEWLAVGPITHTVRDAKLVYEIIADKAFKDSRTDSKDLSNIELLISTDFDSEVKNETIKEVLIAAKQSLLNEGLKSRNIHIKNIGKLHWNFGKMMIKAMKLGLKDWLRNDKDVGISVFVESLRRAIGEKTVSGEIYSVLLASKFLEPSDKDLEKLIQFYKKEKEELYQKMGKQSVLLLPTSGDIALKHNQTIQIDMSPIVPNIFSPMIFTNIMDLPSITVPAWKYRDRKTGLPTSVMLCCLPDSEHLLFEVAAKLENILN